MSTEHVAIPGEFCTLTIAGVAVAASRTFGMSLDAASYGNFVARGTSKWRKTYVADIGGTFDIDGLIVVEEISPTEKQFSDLFTHFAARSKLALIFTLRGTEVVHDPTFVYTCNVYITALSISAPQFGESTYTMSLIITGELEYAAGSVS